MTFTLAIVGILQAFAVALGVGASTLAIINFFVAIADGTIDPAERRMMGVVYIVLRVAMVVILLTSAILILSDYLMHGTAMLTDFTYAQLITLSILYINALLMTLHKMPSTFGPAIQAGSWYTMGALNALVVAGVATFTLPQFLIAYVTWVILCVAIVNGTMAILKARKKEPEAVL